MREILFRGKRVTDGKWLEGSLWLDNGAPKILTPGNCVGYDVAPDTVGQYTGMQTGGQRIFEGDILLDVLGEMQGVVLYSEYDGMFAFYSVEDEVYDFADIDSADFEIIGNIHDNPELLEVGREE